MSAYDDTVPVDTSPPGISLSTSSVYPESTASAFELAKRLGYSGVEVMVGLDRVSADIEAVARVSEYYEVPVTSVHAPCLLLTKRVWGNDPWEKLRMSATAAKRWGASTVVVHPPFRWQRGYATGFTRGLRELEKTTGLTFAVENMYPWRGPAGVDLRAYSPSWDPTDLDCDHLTLDLSHAATARQSSLDLVRAWGSRLRHVHLTDGRGLVADDHLLPGEGNQQADRVLAALAASGFDGQVVVEIRVRTGASRDEREAALAAALDFARRHLRRAE